MDVVAVLVEALWLAAGAVGAGENAAWFESVVAIFICDGRGDDGAGAQIVEFDCLVWASFTSDLFALVTGWV